MIILDSDHLSILQRPASPQYDRLATAMDQSADADFVTTAVSMEEQLRGWLAAINRKKLVHEQVPYYSRLSALVDFYSRWTILPFGEAAAETFMMLRKNGIRIGTMDLKIAAIAISASALLLSANRRDFEQVPGLLVEDWLR